LAQFLQATLRLEGEDRGVYTPISTYQNSCNIGFELSEVKNVEKKLALEILIMIREVTIMIRESKDLERGD
jgi:hypothetical protein